MAETFQLEIVTPEKLVVDDRAEDVARAERAWERAPKRLNRGNAETDFPRAQTALARAQARLEVAGKR